MRWEVRGIRDEERHVSECRHMVAVLSSPQLQSERRPIASENRDQTIIDGLDVRRHASVERKDIRASYLLAPRPRRVCDPLSGTLLFSKSLVVFLHAAC